VIKDSLDQLEPTVPDLARTRPRLGIVVPCFNEEPVIGETIHRLAAVW